MVAGFVVNLSVIAKQIARNGDHWVGSRVDAGDLQIYKRINSWTIFNGLLNTAFKFNRAI